MICRTFEKSQGSCSMRGQKDRVSQEWVMSDLKQFDIFIRSTLLIMFRLPILIRKHSSSVTLPFSPNWCMFKSHQSMLELVPSSLLINPKNNLKKAQNTFKTYRRRTCGRGARFYDFPKCLPPPQPR